MSDEQLSAFLDAVNADAGLQAAMNSAAEAEAEAIVAIAKQAGFDITIEDLEQHNKAIREIDESELDGVVGGNNWYVADGTVTDKATWPYKD